MPRYEARTVVDLIKTSQKQQKYPLWLPLHLLCIVFFFQSRTQWIVIQLARWLSSHFVLFLANGCGKFDILDIYENFEDHISVLSSFSET
jgi:hypothetical protein